MLNKRIFKICMTLSFLFLSSHVYSMNVKTLYDTLILPPKTPGALFQFSAQIQTGFSTVGRNCEGLPFNILQVYNCDQNALKMLEGFDPDSVIGQLRTRIHAIDNGVRGHFCVTGDLKVDCRLDLSGWYYFLDDFSLSLHLPVYSMQLKQVRWQDQTRSISAQDFRVKEYLTNDFFNTVCNLGNLDLCGWKRSGVGDLLALFEWKRDFGQPKKVLKNVCLSGRGGVIIPTGKCQDEDKLFAFAFGNDGATGLLVGGGIDLNLGKYIRTGLDVQLEHYFGHRKCRRVKTHVCQTDFLLLAKAETFKEYALTQRFNLYAEAYRICKGASFKVGYQYIKHGDDYLYMCGCDIPDSIVNTAQIGFTFAIDF